MSLFDGILNSYFRVNSKGDAEYYPNGIFGKGYIVPNKEKENEIRRFLKKFYFTLILIIPVLVTICLFSDFVYVLYLIPLMVIWAIYTNRLHTKNLQTTEKKLKWNESLQNSANSHNKTTLWLLFVASMILSAAGIFLLVLGEGSVLFYLFDITFFGVCSIIYLKMIKMKHS